MKEATGASGAVVTYTSPTATDPAGGTDVVTCTPASGSTFPVGTTKVVCTATDKAGVKGEASFEVEITPQVVAGPPVFSGVPAKVMKEATGASGAVVTYTSPTATDPAGGTDVVTCTPASGSTFPVGTTKVVCTATDKAGVKGEASFEVTVTEANGKVPPAIADTEASGRSRDGEDSHGIRFVLSALLQDALRSLARATLRRWAARLAAIGVHPRRSGAAPFASLAQSLQGDAHSFKGTSTGARAAVDATSKRSSL